MAISGPPQPPAGAAPALADQAALARDPAARLIDAMRDVAAEQGYGAASVSKVIEHAKLSRAAFYECFGGREECFSETYRRAISELWLLFDRSAAISPTSRALGHFVEAAMGWALADPAAARIVLIEIHAASTEARREHYRTLGVLLRRTEEILTSRPLSDDGPRIPALALVGGIAGSIETTLLCEASPVPAEPVTELDAWGRCYAIEDPAARPDFARWRRLAAASMRPPVPAPALRSPALLPRGKGALPPEQCAAARRARILEATAGVVAAKGYAAATVADIAGGARVGRAAFYSQFESKEAAFLAAQEDLFKRGIGVVAGEYFGAEVWPERVWRGLAALLRHFAERPAQVWLAIVDAKAAGPAATASANANRRGYALLLEEGFRQSEDREPPAISPGAAAGAINALLWHHAVRGRGEQMQELLPESAYIALAPFIGAPAAAAFIEERLGAGAPTPGRARARSAAPPGPA
jgi:AcrR family transcriptional regulator